jgi:hypothetical protein
MMGCVLRQDRTNPFGPNVAFSQVALIAAEHASTGWFRHAKTADPTKDPEFKKVSGGGFIWRLLDDAYVR